MSDWCWWEENQAPGLDDLYPQPYRSPCGVMILGALIMLVLIAGILSVIFWQQ